MSDRTVVVLGVGGPQVDALERLRRQGRRVVACGWRREGPGLALCDRFEQVDVKHADEVAALVRRVGAADVVAVGSDLAQATAIEVAHALGLPTFVGLASLPFVRDKHAVRAALAGTEAEVAALRATDRGDLAAWRRFPAAIKPVDGQGQRGVARCADRAELEARLPAALAASGRGAALVEDWLEGPELSLHLWREGGRTTFTWAGDRLAVPGSAGGTPLRHEYPSRVAPAALAALRRKADLACARLGYDEGPVYVQARVTAEGPGIVELAPRLDGCHLWRLILARRPASTCWRACPHGACRCRAPEAAPGRRSPRRRAFGFFHAAPGGRFERASWRAHAARGRVPLLPRGRSARACSSRGCR
ncbi:MAG: hypothetical protein R3F30_13660 [Planctomycetota bacterium]